MLEREYAAEVSIERRKEFGQFFTPPAVADLMAEWILKGSPSTVLDPAFGLGAFYRAVRKRDLSVAIVGYELDEHILSRVDPSAQGDPALDLRHGDYLTSPMAQYDAIICNPPYFRFQKFKNRHIVLPILTEQVGVELLGYANIAALFLLKSLKQLQPGGHLAYIMPYEFLNAGYGDTLKQMLIEDDLLREIVIFENEREVFPDAITTVCVILCEKGYDGGSVLAAHVESNEELRAVGSFEELSGVMIEGGTLNHAVKWTPLLRSSEGRIVIPEGYCQVSTYGAFKRGIATGANEFFALSASKIRQWQIPEEMTYPCITKSRQVSGCLFDREMLQRLVGEDSELYCLNAHDPLDAATAKYLAFGEGQGYQKRYLTRARTPWYKLEGRPPAPLLFGVFSRGRYKVIRNLTQCTNFTCYHGFYPNALGAQYIDRLFLFLLSDLGNRVLATNQRKYGDGLNKFEPNDLNECFVPAPKILERLGTAIIEDAMKSISASPAGSAGIANALVPAYDAPVQGMLF